MHALKHILLLTMATVIIHKTLTMLLLFIEAKKWKVCEKGFLICNMMVNKIKIKINEQSEFQRRLTVESSQKIAIYLL